MGLTITENKTELMKRYLDAGGNMTEVDVYCRKLNDYAKKTYAEEKDVQQNAVQESISVKY